MAYMAGVLLDHVDEHFPKGHLSLATTAPRVGLGELQVRRFVDKALRKSNLVFPIVPKPPPRRPGRLRRLRRRGHGCRRRSPGTGGSLLPGHQLAEPVPLGVGQVAHQPEQ